MVLVKLLPAFRHVKNQLNVNYYFIFQLLISQIVCNHGPSFKARLDKFEEDFYEAEDFGIRAMDNFYEIEEPKLFEMGVFLNDEHPARYVAAFNHQSDEAKNLAKFAYAALKGSSKLIQKYVNESRQVLEELISESTLSSSHRRSGLRERCPRKDSPECPPSNFKYRTADGTCNNLDHPWWGSAMSTMQRFLDPAYDDGVESIRTSVISRRPLPSPRDISKFVHEDRNVPLASITHMLMQWGQFVDHDLTATAQSRGFNGSFPRCCRNRGANFQPPELTHPDCLPIPISSEDSFFSKFGVRCLEFVRSGPAPREDCGFGPREQLSQVTSFLDASMVYSSSNEHSDSLRIFRNGLLLYGKMPAQQPILPRGEPDDLCRRGALSTNCFRAGDGRLSEQPALTALHIVFLRLHNKIAIELSALNPFWTDEMLFQESRKIVGAVIQHITYREFLPIVLGPEVMKIFKLELQRDGFYEDYDPTVNPTIANSFVSAAYRFGHSLVQNSFSRYNEQHELLFDNVSIHEEFNNRVDLHSPGSVDRLLLGLINQPAQRRDEFISTELTNHLFQFPNSPFGMDLASINIQRGRDHGLPAYVNWREPCGLSPIKSWQDLEKATSTLATRKFRKVYESVKDVDLFSAGLAEKPVLGGLIGPTFACIIAQQFSNLRKGDRFWYENNDPDVGFTEDQLEQIRRVSLAQILCKSMDDIDTIQPFVFLTPDTRRNEKIPCDSPFIGKLNLKPWREGTKRYNQPRNELKKVSDQQSKLLNQRRVKPINTNVNQKNRIVVKRPVGASHDNVTIVVQNHAVNTPIFVSDSIFGSQLYNILTNRQTTTTTTTTSTPPPTEFTESSSLQSYEPDKISFSHQSHPVNPINSKPNFPFSVPYPNYVNLPISNTEQSIPVNIGQFEQQYSPDWYKVPNEYELRANSNEKYSLNQYEIPKPINFNNNKNSNNNINRNQETSNTKLTSQSNFDISDEVPKPFKKH